MKLAERLLAELPENTRTIIKQHVRDEALEEAAKVAEEVSKEVDRYHNDDSWEVGFTYGAGVAAERIRALKSKE